jgi:hypothetical protein
MGAFWGIYGVFMGYLWNILYGHFFAFSTVIFCAFTKGV